jgi:uncharacterized membrane protein
VFAEQPNGSEVIFWGLVLIAAICVLGVVVWVVRRWSLATPGKLGEEAWSLQHLREMKAQGQITNEEFESLKERLLRSHRASSDAAHRATSADQT